VRDEVRSRDERRKNLHQRGLIVGIEDATSEATAVFSDAFQVAGDSVGPQVPEMIEADRVLMASRPGMLRKLLPLRIDAAGVTSGGVYLFDTYENAAAYGEWVAEEFILDVGWGDINFLDRPIFIEATSQVWNLIGAEDFADVRTSQDVMRFERWHTIEPVDMDDLRARWPEVRERARTPVSRASTSCTRRTGSTLRSGW
jgi:hypothetical protein